jgi:mono/diheme cytochrome c family protein
MPKLRSLSLVSAFAIALAGCSGKDDGKAPAEVAEGPWSEGAPLPAVEQSHGDAVVGEDLLLNGNYMSCGVPMKLWDNPIAGAAVKDTLGGDGATLEGRTGRNADLPYWLNSFTTTDGAEVLNRNCLSCHGGSFDGHVVVGLGAVADYTNGLTGSTPIALDDATLEALGLDAAEIANMKKILRLAGVIGPDTVMRTVGMNPAERLTGSLIAHHDKDTLAWSEMPLLEIIIPEGEDGQPIEDPRLTSDPPPWWRAHKKNAMFYNGMSRGQHRGTMALATAVCVDNLTEAARVDAMFVDMHEFVLTVRPPAYGRSVDEELAATGKEVFTKTCAGCHGTYADDPTDDEHDTYPNLLIPLDVIGTDSAVADVPLANREMLDYYNDSFYGEIAPAAPDEPFAGYMPPPLDGIWATGPFLHNGSVPTVELVLNSKARPKYWKRVDLDDTHFDEEALGWPYEEVDYPQAEAPEAERKLIYDTTYWSQTNGGHTFGDALTDDERRAVIEYLKTL